MLVPLLLVDLFVAVVSANVGAVEDSALGRNLVDLWECRAFHRFVALPAAGVNVAG